MPDKPKPKSKPIKWTPAQIARMSEITPADVDKAKRRFRKRAPAAIKKLLD